MKIAVVDNDADFVRSLALLLHAQGHEVATYTCPRQAAEELGRARSDVPDVLLVDLAMPGMSGIELVRTLTRQGRVPRATILVSAHTDLMESTDLAEAGIDVFLPKPLGLHALLRALEQLRPPSAVAEVVHL